jgi:hypothetical protein
MQWLPSSRKAALDFEFHQKARAPVAGWLLLGVSCAFCADVAGNYVHVKERTRDAMRRLAVLPAQVRAPVEAEPEYQPRDPERESAFARAVITRMSLPWNDLFRALNATQVEDVQLLGVEPDPEARMVRITAEARDIPAMLTYVARLEGEHYFQRAGLLQQETKRDTPRQGVSFVVAAAWKKP